MTKEEGWSHYRLRVVTYQYAYGAGDITLCDTCADLDDAEDRPFGALGPISHGYHDGRCEYCARRIVAALRKEER